ncbi:hypothetical protein OY671_011212, partial [Metschnikowia pulcherrima]
PRGRHVVAGKIADREQQQPHDPRGRQHAEKHPRPRQRRRSREIHRFRNRRSAPRAPSRHSALGRRYRCRCRYGIRGWPFRLALVHAPSICGFCPLRARLEPAQDRAYFMGHELRQDRHPSGRHDRPVPRHRLRARRRGRH